MRRLHQMKTVQQHAKRQEENALLQLGKIQTKVNAHQQTLNELMDFYVEYSRKLEQKNSQMLKASEYQNYVLFMKQVDKAIEHQKNELADLSEQLMKLKADYLEKNQYQRGVSILIEKLYAEMRLIGQRHEQLETDEFAQRLRR
jgi:flagellar protein FliJ